MNIKNYAYDKKAWTTLIIVLLIGLSWLGNIDKHADKYTHESIVQAGTAYAAARGINALVSILQTSTVGGSFVVTGSVSIGEILDPINDLIERFSSVMVVAFGSLVLQKILLVIVSHELFNSAVTLLGFMLIIMIYVGKTSLVKTVLRLFILFAFVRFSLGIVVLLNEGVDHIFLDSQIVSGSENLDAFRSDLSKINKSDLKEINKSDLSQLKTSDLTGFKDYKYVDTKKIEVLKKSIQDDKDRITLLEHETIPNLKSELGKAEDRVADAEAVLQDLEKENRWSMFGINESQEVKTEKKLLSSYEDARDALLNDISHNESRVEDIKEDIVLKREEIADENDGSLSVYMSVAVGNIIDLLVLFILKAVLIPLLFFYVLINVAREIWDVNLEEGVVGNNQAAVPSA